MIRIKNKRVVYRSGVLVAGLLIVLLVVFVWWRPGQHHTSRSHSEQTGSSKIAAKAKAVAPVGPQSAPRVLFSDPLNGPNRIVTNEFVHFSPNGGCPYTSSAWDMTSGTLFIQNGAGYSGAPTKESSSRCDSSQHTNSAVFRLNTKESDFKNIKVSMDFMPMSHGGAGAPNNSYDGIHIWVGYQSEYALYAATIFRWDNTIVIKKKVPVAQAQCTDVSNDGCYFNLSAEAQNPETAKVWHHVDVTDSVDAQGVVHITTAVDGKQVASGTDASIGGTPYASGAVGVRGDNTEFYFKNFQVTQL